MKNQKKFSNKFFNQLKFSKIPDKPGIYFFLDQKKKPIYIGRATSLRDRVRSYFSGDLIHVRGPIIVDMIFKARNLKWQVTDSVLEALILEANLIKKYQPIYNTKEKSDKSFNYVVMTKEKLPRVLIVRGHELFRSRPSNILKNVRRSSVYGPFTNSNQLREALKILRPIFPFLDEKTGVNVDQKVNRPGQKAYQFYRQIGLVPDVANKKEYLKNIGHLKLFFEGRKNKILKNLEKEMKILAQEQKFEKASEVKKKIFALKHIQDIALLKDDSYTIILQNYGIRIEAYDVAHTSGALMVGVMTVVENGEVNKKEYRKFKIKSFDKANDPGALREILERRFSHPEWPNPRLIVVDGGQAQLNVALKFQKKVGLQIGVVAVVKNEYHKPKGFLGDKKAISKYEKEILLANAEAHRFALAYHRNLFRKRL